MNEFNDVMILPKHSEIISRAEVNLHRKFPFWEGIPIVAANVDTIGTFLTADAMRRHGMMTCISKFNQDWQRYSHAQNGTVAVTAGLRKSGLDYIRYAFEAAHDQPEFILLDVANGYLEVFLGLVEDVALKFPKVPIIAGSVATKEGTENLINAGADIVKVGIGSGSICKTRSVTGVGVPQLKALLDCAPYAHNWGKYILSEGGCSTPGDIAKAFVAGADFVMLGGMLAGHDETGEEYYGMASKYAQLKHYGSIAPHRSIEGIETNIWPLRGPLHNTLAQIKAALQSTGSYIGAVKLEQFPEKGEFIEV